MKDLKRIEVKDEEEVKPKKKQKISVSYTLKSFGNNVKKLKEAKLITEIEEVMLKEMHVKLVKTWVGLEFKTE